MVLRRLRCKGRLTKISFANPVTSAFAAGALWIEKTQKEDCSRLGQTLTTKEDFDGSADRPVPSLEEQARNAKSARTLTPQGWGEPLLKSKNFRAVGGLLKKKLMTPVKFGEKEINGS